MQVRGFKHTSIELKFFVLFPTRAAVFSGFRPALTSSFYCIKKSHCSTQAPDAPWYFGQRYRFWDIQAMWTPAVMGERAYIGHKLNRYKVWSELISTSDN
jgi:hypothetical protein